MDGEAPEDSNKELVTDFAIKGAATRAQTSVHDKGKRRDDVTADICAICLEAITERAVAVPCNHLNFDFLCLVSWLQVQASCPLCKTEVTEVQYDWRSAEDYKTYRVPAAQTTHAWHGSQERSHFGRRRSPPTVHTVAAGHDPALERRRHKYRNRLYSLHVGANRISQYRNFTAQAFAQSSEMQSKARAFLRRELLVFAFLDAPTAPRGGTRDFLVEYILAILKTNELKGSDGRAEDLLAESLGRENARMLLHELEAWLRSPFVRLAEWDERMNEGSMLMPAMNAKPESARRDSR